MSPARTRKRFCDLNRSEMGCNSSIIVGTPSGPPPLPISLKHCQYPTHDPSLSQLRYHMISRNQPTQTVNQDPVATIADYHDTRSLRSKYDRFYRCFKNWRWLIYLKMMWIARFSFRNLNNQDVTITVATNADHHNTRSLPSKVYRMIFKKTEWIRGNFFRNPNNQLELSSITIDNDSSTPTIDEQDATGFINGPGDENVPESVTPQEEAVLIEISPSPSFNNGPVDENVPESVTSQEEAELIGVSPSPSFIDGHVNEIVPEAMTPQNEAERIGIFRASRAHVLVYVKVGAGLLGLYVAFLGTISSILIKENHTTSITTNPFVIFSVVAYAMAFLFFCISLYIQGRSENPNSSYRDRYLCFFKFLKFAFYVLCVFAHLSLLPVVFTRHPHRHDN